MAVLVYKRAVPALSLIAAAALGAAQTVAEVGKNQLPPPFTIQAVIMKKDCLPPDARRRQNLALDDEVRRQRREAGDSEAKIKEFLAALRRGRASETREERASVMVATDGNRFLYRYIPLASPKADPLSENRVVEEAVLFDGKRTFQYRGNRLRIMQGAVAENLFDVPVIGCDTKFYHLVTPNDEDPVYKTLKLESLPGKARVIHPHSSRQGPYEDVPGFAELQKQDGVTVSTRLGMFDTSAPMETWRFEEYHPETGAEIARRVTHTTYLWQTGHSQSDNVPDRERIWNIERVAQDASAIDKFDIRSLMREGDWVEEETPDGKGRGYDYHREFSSWDDMAEYFRTGKRPVHPLANLVSGASGAVNVGTGVILWKRRGR
ncbi:hypothetical protein BH11ARM2_BH11ARM2_03350 [soil metagenome]